MASGKRARDSDREAVVTALHDAFVDGQLDTAEHQRRVDTALESAYVDDLRPLVDDLQVETPAALAVPAATPSPKRPTAPRDDAAERRATWGALGVIAAVAVIGGAVWLGVRGGDDAPTAYDGAPAAVGEVDEAEQADRLTEVVRWDAVELPAGSPDEDAELAMPGLGEWRADEAHLTAFIDAWRDAKGPYYTELTVRPDRVNLTLPTAGTVQRTEKWDYGVAPGLATLWIISGAGRDEVTMDLRDLDVAALFDNIGRAVEDLGLEEGQLSFVSVALDTDGLPAVSIYAKNRHQETAWLQTTLSGSILREYPFDR